MYASNKQKVVRFFFFVILQYKRERKESSTVICLPTPEPCRGATKLRVAMQGRIDVCASGLSEQLYTYFFYPQKTREQNLLWYLPLYCGSHFQLSYIWYNVILHINFHTADLCRSRPLGGLQYSRLRWYHTHREWRTRVKNEIRVHWKILETSPGFASYTCYPPHLSFGPLSEPCIYKYVK